MKRLRFLLCLALVYVLLIMVSGFDGTMVEAVARNASPAGANSPEGTYSCLYRDKGIICNCDQGTLACTDMIKMSARMVKLTVQKELALANQKVISSDQIRHCVPRQETAVLLLKIRQDYQRGCRTG